MELGGIADRGLVLLGCGKMGTALLEARPEERVQFERLGYFVADRVLSKPGAPVFNRTVTLRDSWAKLEQEALAALPRGSGES